jgi:hypothetical protein
MICWGDKVGSFNGPVAVKFWRNYQIIVIEYGACENSNGVSAEDRAIWLTTEYGRTFSFQDVAMPTVTPTATSSVTRTATKTVTVTNSRTATSSPTITRTPSITATKTETPTETDTPSPSETPTETETPSITLTATQTPSKTFTRTRTFTSTRTLTRTRTNTPSRTATRTRTNSPTRSRTPTITVIRFPISNWNSKGKVQAINVEEKWTCWGQINGIDNLVVYYRVSFANPEYILGNCQNYPYQSAVDITNYLIRTTGRPWKVLFKP